MLPFGALVPLAAPNRSVEELDKCNGDAPPLAPHVDGRLLTATQADVVLTGTGSMSWAICSASMLLLSDSSSVLVLPFRLFTVPLVVVELLVVRFDVKEEFDVTGFNGSNELEEL